jgi:hypothetical protein
MPHECRLRSKSRGSGSRSHPPVAWKWFASYIIPPTQSDAFGLEVLLRNREKFVDLS